jgi:hypothetical protein
MIYGRLNTCAPLLELRSELLDNKEILQLQACLRERFNLDLIEIRKSPKQEGVVIVYIGEKPIGLITRDDEDDDVSYDFELPVPGFDQQHLRDLFSHDSIDVKARSNKDDSVEVYIGEEFIGVIFRVDDSADASYALNMAILDFDLPELS